MCASWKMNHNWPSQGEIEIILFIVSFCFVFVQLFLLLSVEKQKKCRIKRINSTTWKWQQQWWNNSVPFIVCDDKMKKKHIHHLRVNAGIIISVNNIFIPSSDIALGRTACCIAMFGVCLCVRTFVWKKIHWTFGKLSSIPVNPVWALSTDVKIVCFLSTSSKIFIYKRNDSHGTYNAPIAKACECVYVAL